VNLLCHLTATGFSNTYVVHDGPDAVVVDPGGLDRQLLLHIEGRRLRLRAVLLTHRHPSHTDGLRAMRRIWEFEVWARDPGYGQMSSREARDGQRLDFGSIEVLCLEVPGHSPDSLCFRIGDWLFTGDTLMAGEIGSTRDGLLRRVLVDSIWSRLLVWPDDTPVFAGHGPPTRVGVERRFNPYLVCGPRE